MKAISRVAPFVVLVLLGCGDVRNVQKLENELPALVSAEKVERFEEANGGGIAGWTVESYWRQHIPVNVRLTNVSLVPATSGRGYVLRVYWTGDKQSQGDDPTWIVKWIGENAWWPGTDTFGSYPWKDSEQGVYAVLKKGHLYELRIGAVTPEVAGTWATYDYYSVKVDLRNLQ